MQQDALNKPVKTRIR